MTNHAQSPTLVGNAKANIGRKHVERRPGGFEPDDHLELSRQGGLHVRGDFRPSSQDGCQESVWDSENIVDSQFLSSTNQIVSSDYQRLSDQHQKLSNYHGPQDQAAEDEFSNVCASFNTSTTRTPRDPPTVDGSTSDGVPPMFAGEPDIIYDASMGFNRYCSYAPVVYTHDLMCCTVKSSSFPANKLGSLLNIPGWLHELTYENDRNLREYLLAGVQHGFFIVDQEVVIPTYEGKNYFSVTKGEAHTFINDLIISELRDGKFVVASSKPHCIHAVGAVPKRSGGWRPITDCKRPIGSSINSFMTTTYKEFCYSTVDNVIELIRPGCYMASVDIQAAYRSILVHPTQWTYQGISWTLNGKPTFLCDTHVCFGLKCAPYLFTQVTNFVLRCLKRRGFDRCLVYLDDYLVLGDTRQQCEDAQLTLISILRSLGFYVSWKKCAAATQIITYLGVVFNSRDMSVSLTSEKMSRLQQEIAFFTDKTRATKLQVQRLCGLLAHCAKVVKGEGHFPKGSSTC